MQTSATGKADRQARAGFTLVELMMVVAIIGLAAGAVVLSVPDPRPSVGMDAERFAARLVRAREEAILTNRAVAVDADAAGYAFTSFDGARWSPLIDGPFGPEAWTPDTTVAARDGEPRVLFDPTGAAEPVTLAVSRDGQGVVVSVDGAGEVRIDD